MLESGSPAKLIVDLGVRNSKSGSFFGFRFCYGFLLFCYGGEG